MQKQIADKKILIGICAAVAVIAAAVLVLLVNKEEAFRSILVYEVEGTAVIERENVGSMNAAENLYLESGDRVSIAKDSSMRMKLDDDKYVMAEADTIFSIEAEGTDKNSRTRICLEQGAITNEIQNPLSKDSQYETSTPNSVMAVRGTIYRVELFIDENGGQNTKLCCFQGKVGTKPILPDGTYGEEVLVPAGSELTVYSDGAVDDPKDIVYEELPAQTLWTLKKLLESGQSMEGITMEYLEGLINKEANVSEDSEEDSEEESEESEPEQPVLSDTEENSEQGDTAVDTDVADTAKNTSKQTGKDAKKNAGTPQTAEALPEQEPQIADEAQPKESEVSEPVGSVSSDNDNTEESSSQDGNTDDDSGNHSDNNSEQDNNIPDNKPENNEPVAPPKVVTYTVTFEYDGKTFATQEVKSGETVSEPLLTPEANGKWNFDFETRIKADTTIKWE